MSNFYFKQIEIGPMQNFIYFVGCSTTKQAAIVDPAWEPETLTTFLENEGYTLSAIILTHGHHDHVNGLPDILSRYDIPVYISVHEAALLTPDAPNLVKVDNNEQITIGDLVITVLHTPGHSPGSQCLLIDKTLISGDTLFINGCGRCDLPGGDASQLFQSLMTKIMPLDDDIMIYPGHNYSSSPCDSLKNQKMTNPYLLPRNQADFISSRS